MFAVRKIFGVPQEVFLEVYQSIHRFRNESKLSTWLYRIAVNKSLNFVRKEKWKKTFTRLDGVLGREKEVPREIPDGDPENMPESIEYQERRIIMQKAIDSLPKNQRIAFILSKYDDQSYQEIATILILFSWASVESLIHRAKLNLQKKLVNYYKKSL